MAFLKNMNLAKTIFQFELSGDELNLIKDALESTLMRSNPANSWKIKRLLTRLPTRKYFVNNSDRSLGLKAGEYSFDNEWEAIEHGERTAQMTGLKYTIKHEIVDPSAYVDTTYIQVEVLVYKRYTHFSNSWEYEQFKNKVHELQIANPDTLDFINVQVRESRNIQFYQESFQKRFSEDIDFSRYEIFQIKIHVETEFYNQMRNELKFICEQVFKEGNFVV